MIVWYLYARATGHPISHMFVVMPALILSPIIGYVVSRSHPRRSRAELEDLTLWTLT